MTDPDERSLFLGLPPEGYRDYGDPWPPPRPPGRLRAFLHRLWASLWAPEDPDARIHPDGGPGPHSGPYPWEIPGPDLSVDKLRKPLAGGYCTAAEFYQGCDDLDAASADMAAALDRAEERFRRTYKR